MPELEVTLKDRGASYGDYSDLADLSQRLKLMLQRPGLAPAEKESLDLICTKLARLIVGRGDRAEHWHDIAGYATLAERDLAGRTVERPSFTIGPHML